MIRRLARLGVRLAAAAAVAWFARELLRRWVDGPEPAPGGPAWPPLAPPPVPERRPEPAVPERRPEPAVPERRPEPAVPERRPEPAVEAEPGAEPASRPATARVVTSGAAARPTRTVGARLTPATPAGRTRRPSEPPAGAAWLAPGADGSMPPTHPVKAKNSSRLYHLPGMAAYERTSPDRCYATPEAAEADGYTRAKR